MKSVLNRSTLAALAVAFLTTFAPGAFADGTVTSLKGEVRSKLAPAIYGPVIQNQKLRNGETLTTGPGAQAVIRFDDGETAVVNENSEFKVERFVFQESRPEADSAVFSLLKGALRMVSGAIGKRKPSAFALHTPMATIGIRGTDFMFAVVNNSGFLQVTEGTITATNAAGTATFGAGTAGSVASAATLGTTIPASSLPGAASGAFGNMSAVTVSAAGGAASGAVATGTAAAGGAGAGVAIGTAAAVAGVAAASSSSSTTTHH